MSYLSVMFKIKSSYDAIRNCQLRQTFFLPNDLRCTATELRLYTRDTIFSSAKRIRPVFSV